LKDDDKSREQLVNELTELRLQNAALKKTTTENMSTELVVKDALNYAESIVDTVRNPLLVLDVDLRAISANRSFYSTFEVNPAETIGNFIYCRGHQFQGKFMRNHRIECHENESR
jgi:PAS domain-containing protein